MNMPALLAQLERHDGGRCDFAFDYGDGWTYPCVLLAGHPGGCWPLHEPRGDEPMEAAA